MRSMYVCVCVLEMTCTSNCSRAAALGTPISKCQQVGRLASRGIKRQLLERGSELSCKKGFPAGKDLCREGPRRPGVQQVVHEPVVYPCNQEGQ